MYVGHSSSLILYFARSSVGCDSDHCGNKEEKKSYLITRPPEAAESQYIIVSSSIMHKERVSTLFFYSGSMIPLFLCKSR